MNRVFPYLIVLFTNSFLFGQIETEIDTASIISYVDKIIPKINLTTQTDTYYNINKTTGARSTLTPNDKLKLSVSVDYEFIGASIGFAPAFLPRNNDDNLKGKSSFINYELRFFFDHWVHEIFHSRVKGFYIQNTEDFIQDWIRGKDSFIQFPNLKTLNWNATTSYSSNPNLSLRNIFYQTEWQRRSERSFIPSLHFGYNEISNIVSEVLSVEKNLDANLIFNYYNTKVIKSNWYISTIISPSLGIRLSNYKKLFDQDKISEGDFFIIKSIKGGLQFGFSNEKVIYGANLNFDVNWHGKNEFTTVINNKIHGKIFVGYRLESPDFIQKPFEWLDEIF